MTMENLNYLLRERDRILMELESQVCSDDFFELQRELHAIEREVNESER